jgi:nucleotide-binding universal stress UspA family protein
MYRRILVPTDGSACSAGAVEHAVELAKVGGSRVTFLYVMDTARNYHEALMSEVRRELSDEGERALRHAQGRAADAGVDAHIELVEGDPADVISDYSEDFDLIVMGSHGKGLWRRLTVGSVSQVVLRRLTRPVLLVPCADAKSAR